MRTLLALLAVTLIRLLCLTWRVREIGPLPDPSTGPRVYCFWHGRQAGLLAHARPRPVAVLVSHSKDGDLQAKILGKLGFAVTRGSSSRGGAAGLKGVVDLVREGRDTAFAVDGPRGPLHRVKTGAVLVARQTGGLIVPVISHASRAWVFERAWDRYQLPKPFARVELVRGPAISTGGKPPEEVRAELERSLGALSGQDQF